MALGSHQGRFKSLFCCISLLFLFLLWCYLSFTSWGVLFEEGGIMGCNEQVPPDFLEVV